MYGEIGYYIDPAEERKEKNNFLHDHDLEFVESVKPERDVNISGHDLYICILCDKEEMRPYGTEAEYQEMRNV